MIENFSEAPLGNEDMRIKKHVEVKLKMGREISPKMQDDLLRFYGFKVVSRGKSKTKDEN